MRHGTAGGAVNPGDKSGSCFRIKHFITDWVIYSRGKNTTFRVVYTVIYTVYYRSIYTSSTQQVGTHANASIRKYEP